MTVAMTPSLAHALINADDYMKGHKGDRPEILQKGKEYTMSLRPAKPGEKKISIQHLKIDTKNLAALSSLNDAELGSLTKICKSYGKSEAANAIKQYQKDRKNLAPQRVSSPSTVSSGNTTISPTSSIDSAERHDVLEGIISNMQKLKTEMKSLQGDVSSIDNEIASTKTITGDDASFESQEAWLLGTHERPTDRIGESRV